MLNHYTIGVQGAEVPTCTCFIVVVNHTWLESPQVISMKI